jgi:hypothetical protein
MCGPLTLPPEPVRCQRQVTQVNAGVQRWQMRRGIVEVKTTVGSVLPFRHFSTDFMQVPFEPRHISVTGNSLNFNCLRNPY